MSMILSRPWADEDEMLEDERLNRAWALSRFGGFAATMERYEEPDEEDNSDDYYADDFE